ncbi:restriction endonuclease [Streptomyces celluloflavus]|uniref:restriction endonuclease n=1 Tax=Streptomyces celluloflavus TaxID=58344 RepID=UPI00369C423F
MHDEASGVLRRDTEGEDGGEPQRFGLFKLRVAFAAQDGNEGFGCGGNTAHQMAGAGVRGIEDAQKEFRSSDECGAADVFSADRAGAYVREELGCVLLGGLAGSLVDELQRPQPGSVDAADLELVCKYFDRRKHDFEDLAAAVAARVLRGTGQSYLEGWLTRHSGDGGADFAGWLDLGSGLAGTSLVVLGQAKCVKPDTLITAEQIARVVARLRRGWIGIYVTTGAYSERAQAEMVEDQCPIVLINGMSMVHELRSMARDDHGGNLSACIGHTLAGRNAVATNRRPEEILLQ